MKTVGVEIERRQVAMAWVSVPSHWEYDRAKQEVARNIEAIREAADAHKQPLEWGKVYGPQYALCAVISVNGHAEFEPDYCFPDEAPPAHPEQITLEL
jgi:hypothetical protein